MRPLGVLQKLHHSAALVFVRELIPGGRKHLDGSDREPRSAGKTRRGVLIFYLPPGSLDGIAWPQSTVPVLNIPQCSM
jgi:hypothetical protein